MKRLLGLLLSGGLAVMAPLAQGLAQEEPLIRVGLTPGGHEPGHAAVFDETRRLLEARFGAGRVRFRVIHTSELMADVMAGRLNFFISTAGLSRRMMSQGTKDLLTITSPRFPDPNHAYGSVFLVRRDSPCTTIACLKGASLVSNRAMGFYGYVAAMGELEARGFDHSRFFSRQIFLDAGSFKVIDALLRGEADAATVPSCFLEDNFAPESPQRAALRVLEPRPGPMPCARSTDDYPNWTLSSAPGVSPELAREVMQALLSSRPESGYRWSVATDFSAVDALYRSMKTGVYDVLKHWTLKGFWERYQQWVLAAGALLALLCGYSLLLKRLVDRRGRELSASLARQLDLQRKAAEAERRFELMQKAGLIGQMSSMIAHELRQPLSSLQAYIHGLLRMTERTTFDRGLARRALFKMAGETESASRIVDKVRLYARRRAPAREQVDAAAVARQALDAFRASGRFAGAIQERRGDGRLPVLADPMELELAILNLLRNAADALKASGRPHPEIRLAVKKDGGLCRITVSDNGPALAPDALRRLGEPLQSAKPEGLGLGLVIVRSIAESHGGRLLLEALPGGGLSAALELPLQEEEKES